MNTETYAPPLSSISTPQDLQSVELNDRVLERLNGILKRYDLFHIVFIALICTELFFFVFNFTWFVQHFALSVHIALIVATIFCYLTLRIYFYTRKNEALVDLKNQFLQIRSTLLGPLEETVRHTQMAQACFELANFLYAKEYRVYSQPGWLDFLEKYMEKWSCWAHWQEFQFLKELLLQQAVEEQIKLVRLLPTDLESHVGLANAYVMLSGLYVDPHTIEGLSEDRWIPLNKYNAEAKSNFERISKMAVEEFKILSDFAPDDPWVHAQLAYSYHDLQMPQEEIREYEIILKLTPDDKEILFKLGQLYFKQGLNARGLEIYEILKKSNHKKAENLIVYYGAIS